MVRLLGIALVAFGATAFQWLTHLVAHSAAARSTSLEFLVAFVAVTALLGGLPMLALGKGLFALTDVPIQSWYVARTRKPRS